MEAEEWPGDEGDLHTDHREGEGIARHGDEVQDGQVLSCPAEPPARQTLVGLGRGGGGRAKGEAQMRENLLQVH
jgi:hypothetical protein